MAILINHVRVLLPNTLRMSPALLNFEQKRFRRGSNTQNRVPKVQTNLPTELDQTYSLQEVTSKAVNKMDRSSTPNKYVVDHDDCDELHHVSKLPRYKKINGWDKDNRDLNILGKILSSKKDRSESDSLVIEGVRNIKDAIECGCLPTVVVFSRLKLLEQLQLPLKPADCQLYHIPYSSINMWSDLSTSPGVMAAFSKKVVSQVKAESPLAITLVCDNIRQPDNLGALIRVAAGAGARKVILTKGCTDPWGPKAMKAAAGAHFHIPVVEGVGWDVMKDELPDQFPQVVLADLVHVLKETPCNEETLHKLEEKSLADGYNTVTGEIGREVAYLDEELCDQYKNVPVRTRTYSDFSIDPGYKEVVVVVGGETEGVSGAAYRFCHKLNGSKLHVPLCNGMESLNLVSAASVVMFRVQQALLGTG